MNDESTSREPVDERLSDAQEEAPGDIPGAATAEPRNLRAEVFKLGVGFAISLLLTGASFWAAESRQVYGPSIPVLLAALAIGQMGVHLLFFLHVSSGPEATNNILALAFGVFVVALVVFGSMVIMANLDAGMGMPTAMTQAREPW